MLITSEAGATTKIIQRVCDPRVCYPRCTPAASPHPERNSRLYVQSSSGLTIWSHLLPDCRQACLGRDAVAAEIAAAGNIRAVDHDAEVGVDRGRRRGAEEHQLIVGVIVVDDGEEHRAGGRGSRA